MPAHLCARGDANTGPARPRACASVPRATAGTAARTRAAPPAAGDQAVHQLAPAHQVILTINVLLILQVRDIFFFMRENT